MSPEHFETKFFTIVKINLTYETFRVHLQILLQLYENVSGITCFYPSNSLLPRNSCFFSRQFFCFFGQIVSIYMFKVNNRNTRTRCEICSKLTIKTPERNSEHISHLVLVFLQLNFEHVNADNLPKKTKKLTGKKT